MTANGKKSTKAVEKRIAEQHTHQMTPGQLMKGICGAKGSGITLAPEIKGTKNACPNCLKVLERMEAKAKAKEEGPISEQGNKGAAKVREMAGLPLLGEQPVPAAKLDGASAPTKPAKAPKAPRAPKATKKATAGATGGDEAKTAAEPKERDERLPPAGTKLFKANRDGKKVECVVTDAGAIDYAGKLYKTLSGAARAAAKDLGLATSQNGFLFWGVIRQARTVANPSSALMKAYDRFDKTVDAITAGKPEGEVKAKLAESLRQMAAELTDAANKL